MVVGLTPLECEWSCSDQPARTLLTPKHMLLTPKHMRQAQCRTHMSNPNCTRVLTTADPYRALSLI